MLVREGEREAVAKKYVLLDNISLTAPEEPHHVLRIDKSLLATGWFTRRSLRRSEGA